MTLSNNSAAAGGVDNEGTSVTIPAPLPTPSTTSTIPENYFSAEQVEAIRTQEKDKLYGRLTQEQQARKDLEDRLKVFESQQEEANRLAAEAQAQADAQRRAREEEELSAKDLIKVKEDEWKRELATVQQEMQRRLDEAENERKQAAALLEMERNFQALETYKNRRLAEEAAAMTIMPDLMDFVVGNTEDEIEASISALVQKTSAIVDSIQQNLPPTQRLRGVPTTGGAPTGPLDNYTEQQTLTVDDLKNLSMNEYAKIRERLLPAASNRTRY